MKLTAMLFLTLDGVYQGPGAPDEDRRGGFERGGWLAPHSDGEIGRAITSVYERADAPADAGRVAVDTVRLMIQTYRPAGRATFGTAG